MTTSLHTATGAPAAVVPQAAMMRAVRSRDPIDLETILDADVEVVEVLDAVAADVRAFADDLVRQRRLSEPLQAWCAIGEVRREDTCTLREAIAPLASVAGFDAFARWLEHWADGFAALNDVTTVGLRVSHLRGPMCPFFHVDHVPTRFIATLTGPSTEWLPAHLVRRDDDGRIDQDVARHQIERFDAGSVGLFKGAGFDDGVSRGIVHRSPPNEADRIVLTLDAVA